MRSYHCEFCQEELKFRNIGGVTVPLHPKGSDCEGKKYYRSEQINKCFRVECPVCEQKVFFIRHNGGSAWFDHLGKPWPKHGCMDTRQPAPWESLMREKGEKLLQLWIYGTLRTNDGIAGVFFDKPSKSGPRFYRYDIEKLGVRRLHCAQEHIDSILKQNGLLIIQTDDGHYLTLKGEALVDGGSYEAKFVGRNWT